MPLDDRLADEVKQASRSIATVEFFGRDYWWEDVGRRQFSISFEVKSMTLCCLSIMKISVSPHLPPPASERTRESEQAQHAANSGDGCLRC